MDPAVFEVDHPVVAVDQGPGQSVWDHAPPAPLLLAALVSAGDVVADLYMRDPLLSVLAARLGAEVVTVSPLTDAGDDARVNNVSLATSTELPQRFDLLIISADEPIPVDAEVVLSTVPLSSTGSLRRIDVVDCTVVVDGPEPPSTPFVLVVDDRVSEIEALLRQACDAFAGRTVNPWAQAGIDAALRVAGQARERAIHQQQQSAAQVDRAYEQMRQARDELRGVRSSRSWRYTGLIRKLSAR